jgi:hypothetical protein
MYWSIDMYSFDDSLEGMFFTTKAELNSKWTTLREAWETMVRPYAVPTYSRADAPGGLYTWELGPNKNGRQPPEYLLNAYLRWRNAHKAYHLIAQRAMPNLLGVWEDALDREQLRYNNTYNRLFPGTLSRRRPPTQEQINTDTPGEVDAELQNPASEPENQPKEEKSFMQTLKDDIGTYALVIGGGILAYNIFFRLAEGGFFRSKPKYNKNRGEGI